MWMSMERFWDVGRLHQSGKMPLKALSRILSVNLKLISGKSGSTWALESMYVLLSSLDLLLEEDSRVVDSREATDVKPK